MERKEIYVETNKKPNACKFLYACKMGYCAKIANYICRGGNINAVTAVSRKSGLMLALENKHHTAAMLLLNCGIDLTIKDFRGRTAKDYADNNFKEIIDKRSKPQEYSDGVVLKDEMVGNFCKLQEIGDEYSFKKD